YREVREMDWITRLFHATRKEPEPVDIQALLNTCTADPRQKSDALVQLEREYRRLRRQRKNLQKRMSWLSKTRVRSIGRSGPIFGPIQLRTDMRAMNDAGENMNMSLQESGLEEWLREVTRAMTVIRSLPSA